jgi:hypothetical protein
MKKNGDAQATKPTTFRNRDSAESQVCKAFVALGQLAGVDTDNGTGPADLDAALIAAAYQSNYGDPHFLGGPFCFNYAVTTADVDKLAGKSAAVTQGFADYFRDRGRQEALAEAETHIALIEAAIAWLRKTNRSR